MADVNLYLHNVDKNPPEALRIATDAARRIENKQLKLLDVIQSMGEHMTDDDATVRAKSIGYLSAVLAALDPKTLVWQQVSVITQFLTDRLEDETGLKEVAGGLMALLGCQRFGAEDAEKVTLALLNVDLRKHPQGTRFIVLKVMDQLFARHRDVLKKLGDLFLDGFIELVEGEKDPRNLMIVFSLLKVIIVEFDIDRHAEELFKSCYVYYPITFTPPPNDPYGITAQDLKVRLRNCLAGSGRFAEYVFTPLIEKLDSTSQSVKRDVLQTMAVCAISYGPGKMAKYFSTLWDAIKYEVLNSSDDELAAEALNTIQAIAISLSNGFSAPPLPTTSISRYLKSIVKETLELLKEPQQKQAKPAGQILASVAGGGVIPYVFIIENTFPVLLTVYDDAAGGISKQKALLEVLSQIFESTVAVYGEWGDMAPCPTIHNPLVELKEKLFDIYSKALMGTNKEEVGFRIIALKGLGTMSKIRNLFADNEIGMVVQYLDEVVLETEEESWQGIKEIALQHLLQISTMKPNFIMDITFPALMATLPDSELEAREKSYLITLEALAKLSTKRSVFEVLVTRLFNKLDVIIQNGSGPTYPRALLSTLLYVLQQKSAADHQDLPMFYDRLVPTLITKTVGSHIAPAEESNTSSAVMADESILEVTGRIVSLIVRSLDDVKQDQVVHDAYDLFIFNKPSTLISKSPESVARTFRPFGVDRVAEHVPYMFIFTCIIAVLRQQVKLPIEDIPAFINEIKSSIPQLDLPQKAPHLRLVAIILNKWMPPSLSSDLSSNSFILNLIKPSSSSSTLSPEDTIRTAFWVTKSLSMKGDKLSEPLTQQLVDLLSDRLHGGMAAKGFAILLGEDELLNKHNYAVYRLLSKQKVFSLVVPKLVEGFKRTADQTLKPNYLVALSIILRHIPSQIFLPSLPQLVPLLLQSLDLPTPPGDQGAVDVKLATLSTLAITILESANALQEHVSSLITRLLATATYSGDPASPGAPPRVRKEALRCLRIFPGTLRSELLLPYKRQVVRGLVSCLDDVKRGVRKEAVECRARWTQLDEPVDE